MDKQPEGMRIACVAVAVIVIDGQAFLCCLAFRVDDRGISREVTLVDQVVVLAATTCSEEDVVRE